MKTPYEKLHDHIAEFHDHLLTGVNSVEGSSHAHSHYMHALDHRRYTHNHHEYVLNSTIDEEDIAFEDQ